MDMSGLSRFFPKKRKKYLVTASVIKTKENKTVKEILEVLAFDETEARTDVKKHLMDKHHTGLVFIKSVLEKSW